MEKFLEPITQCVFEEDFVKLSESLEKLFEENNWSIGFGDICKFMIEKGYLKNKEAYTEQVIKLLNRHREHTICFVKGKIDDNEERWRVIFKG